MIWRCLIFLFLTTAAWAQDAAFRVGVQEALAKRGLGRDAPGIIGNVLSHEAPPPRGVPPLVHELLKDPVAAVDAATVFRRAVPAALIELAEGAVGRSEESFDALLERYIAQLAEAQALLRSATRPFDEAGVVRALREGMPVGRLPQVMDAVDSAALDRAITLFVEATARFVREVRSPGMRLPEGGLRRESAIGLVVVGTSGPDRHGPDAALIIDPGGDDIYERAPAIDGAVSVIIDLAGNDQYGGTDVAVRGLSALIDIAGDDRYAMTGAGLGAAIAGASILVDLAGNDRYEAGIFGQGAAAFGLGALLDLSGDDRYALKAFGQGYAGTAGVGLLWDRAGNDAYTAAGLPDAWQREGGISFAQGVSSGFRDPLGGGIGILRDDAGDDSYEAQMFAQGTGYYYGLGLLWDGGGNDRYRAVRYAQGNGVHQAVGILRDEGGDDRYELSGGVGQGMGLDLAVGVLFDGAGNDQYQSSYVAQGSGTANGFGLLSDRAGENRWRMGSDLRAWGHAEWSRRLPTVGVLLYDPAHASFSRDDTPAAPAEPAIVHEADDSPGHCPDIAPASAAGPTPLVEAMVKVMPNLPAGNPDRVIYGELLRRVIDDPAATMSAIAPGNFDLMYAFGEILPCALAAATPEEAARMWPAFDAALANPRTPFLGTIAAALQRRPGPPETMQRLRAALEAHPNCAVRVLSIATSSESEAREALRSSCWRLQAVAFDRLKALGALQPEDNATLPSFFPR